jgi:hypothetical protein
MGKLQHPDWKDAGEALGRPDMAGVMMPAGKAEDVSSTFPTPTVKVEDNWNEVSFNLCSEPHTLTLPASISFTMSPKFVRDIF